MCAVRYACDFCKKEISTEKDNYREVIILISNRVGGSLSMMGHFFDEKSFHKTVKRQYCEQCYSDLLVYLGEI